MNESDLFLDKVEEIGVHVGKVLQDLQRTLINKATAATRDLGHNMFCVVNVCIRKGNTTDHVRRIMLNTEAVLIQKFKWEIFLTKKTINYEKKTVRVIEFNFQTRQTVHNIYTYIIEIFKKIH